MISTLEIRLRKGAEVEVKTSLVYPDTDQKTLCLDSMTAQEIYRKIDLQYTMEDANIQLINKVDADGKYAYEELHLIPAKIEEKYHVDYNELLKSLATGFYDYQDTNVPDKETWDMVINDVLTTYGYKEGEKII